MVMLRSTTTVVALPACIAAALVVSLLSGCASSGLGPRLPTRAETVRYQALYQGVDSSCAEQPQLGASTSLSTVEMTFPMFGSTEFKVPGRHQLFIGFRLDASKCVGAYYLAGITFGPGALVTVNLAQPILVPGALALALPAYQVVELPLNQFPTEIRVMVESVHWSLFPVPPLSAATDRTYVRLAGS